MNWSVWPLLALFTQVPAELPQVEVSTLQGTTVSGRLEGLTLDELRLSVDGKPTSLPRATLLDLRFPDRAPASDLPGAVTVQLRDGSRLQGTGVTAAGGKFSLAGSQAGTITLPAPSVASVRMTAPDAQVDAQWNQLLERDRRQDMVVVRKGEVLDHLDGVIGAIDEKTVKFLLDGDEIPVKRERVFGLLYATKESASPPATRLQLVNGEVWLAHSVILNGDGWQVQLAPGAPAVILPADRVRTVDLSAGKLAFLSSMEPRDVRYVPFFDYTWEYCRDKSFEGRPIAVGSRQYARGLAIHSRSQLVYRLGGDYRRFQAVAAIDPEIRVRNVLQLTITGDGKPLFQQEVAAGAAPIPLDLDVSNVAELTILVDFGSDDLDIGDRLHLADAKLIK